MAQAPVTETTLPADNQPDAKQMKPPYRHYTISYSIDVHGIDFATSPDGSYRGNFEYGVRVYNADGDEIVNSVSTTRSRAAVMPGPAARNICRSASWDTRASRSTCPPRATTSCASRCMTSPATASEPSKFPLRPLRQRLFPLLQHQNKM